jgi:Fe-S-cluster containining protein
LFAPGLKLYRNCGDWLQRRINNLTALQFETLLSEHSIADYLGEDDIVRFALDNLLANPGALVVAHGEIFAIPTLVPARRPDGACRFLKNDLCSIHPVNPFGCAFFSAEQTTEQSDAISAHGLMEIMRSWRQGDLYARLWARLYEAGCIAPSPLEARANMKAAIEAVECSGGNAQ